MKTKEVIRGEIISKIKKELNREVDQEITGDSLLREEISIDSLDMVLVIGDVEDTYGITIDEEVMARLETVDDVVDLVMKGCK